VSFPSESLAISRGNWTMCDEKSQIARTSREFMVDLVGIEPTTSSMPWKRAPSCATGPTGGTTLFSRSGSDSSTKAAVLGEYLRGGDRWAV
jgi:hypothetical protein